MPKQAQWCGEHGRYVGPKSETTGLIDAAMGLYRLERHYDGSNVEPGLRRWEMPLCMAAMEFGLACDSDAEQRLLELFFEAVSFSEREIDIGG